MSKIKDLLAVEENIDDLKPLPHKYDLSFFKAVQEIDKKRLADTVLNSCKNQAFQDWLAEEAEFGHGDDDGEPCMFFENFTALCEEGATNALDSMIKDQHLDLNDAEYADVVRIAADYIADYYADYEDSLCADALVDWRNSHDEDNERRGLC